MSPLQFISAVIVGVLLAELQVPYQAVVWLTCGFLGITMASAVYEMIDDIDAIMKKHAGRS